MLSRAQAIEEAIHLMSRYAERSGLDSDRPPRRYLWTDAFGVCNFLALARATGEPRYRELALGLVEQVHAVLGRYRPDDTRRGWLSGLGDEEGARHPTAGGLRIGKALPERSPGQELDERLEWERDGQYFHYLTKWMHALDQVARDTQLPRFNRWARELADTAHRAFTVRAGHGGARRMMWKMSTDLTRPLVASMGHHDPLDGFVTCLQLELTASRLPDAAREPDLKRATAEFASMIEMHGLATDDALGLGGLLIDATRVDELVEQSTLESGELFDALLRAAAAGLALYTRQGELEDAVSRRLAFRELGLAIGLRSFERLAHERATQARSAVSGYLPLAARIESCWRDPAHQRTRLWVEHRDINEVMLATCLLPEAFHLRLR